MVITRYIMGWAQVRSVFLTHTQRTRQEISAQICALYMKLCLLLELIYDTTIVQKTSINWWNQGVFRPKLFGFAATAASRHNASCDGSGPRGLGFESRHSDQKECPLQISVMDILFYTYSCRKELTASKSFDIFKLYFNLEGSVYS